MKLSDSYFCDGQMNIFDYLPAAGEEERMVREVGSQIGVEFNFEPFESKYNMGRGEWVGRYKGLIFTIGYDINCDGQKFISVGWDNKKTHAGGGAPRDNIEEAVEYFNRIIREETKGDCPSCKYMVWLHKNGKATRGCQYHGGHGCHYEPKPRQVCNTCEHYRTIVDAYSCEPIEKRCNPGDGLSYPVSNPETHSCEKWEERNEVSRT